MNTKEQPTNDNIHDCPICLSLLFRPITLRCGHNFCEQCIGMHSFQKGGIFCPVCRRAVVIKIGKYGRNILLEECIKKIRPEEYNEKLNNWQHFKAPGWYNCGKRTFRDYLVLFSSVVLRICKEIRRWSPILTLVVAIALYLRFRKRMHEGNIKVSKDAVDHMMDKLKGTLPQPEGQKEIDLQKVIVSKFMKYLFSNYAKLALI